MPRPPRLLAPQLSHHVVHRGINQQCIFRSDDDKQDFLRIVSKVLRRRQVSILSFCLMDNHYHLHVMDPRENLSQAMQFINSVYTQRYNRRYGSDGALLRGRFYSKPVWDARYAVHLFRYIHLNPVAAGMVASPAAYPWTSFAHYADGARLTLVNDAPNRLLMRALEVAPDQLERWLLMPLPYYDAEVPQQAMGCGAPLLSHLWGEDWPDQQMAARSPTLRERLLAITDACALAWRVSPSEVFHASRATADVRRARSAALLQCVEEAGATYTELCTVFNLSYNSIGALIHRARKLRDRQTLQS